MFYEYKQDKWNKKHIVSVEYSLIERYYIWVHNKAQVSMQFASVRKQQITADSVCAVPRCDEYDDSKIRALLGDRAVTLLDVFNSNLLPEADKVWAFVNLSELRTGRGMFSIFKDICLETIDRYQAEQSETLDRYQTDRSERGGAYVLSPFTDPGNKYKFSQIDYMVWKGSGKRYSEIPMPPFFRNFKAYQFTQDQFVFWAAKDASVLPFIYCTALALLKIKA